MLAGVPWTEVGLGCTAAAVYKFDNGLYLKTIERDPLDPVFGNLVREHARLEALSSRVPVPKVIAFEEDGSREFLITTEIPGREACSPATQDVIQTRVGEIARACRRFHDAPTRDFSFVELARDLRETAARRVALDLVDNSDFDPERRGRSARDLLDELYEISPNSDDVVLTHGDMCLPNVILLGNHLSGFVDVGRSALSDRWRDLALCLRSVDSNWGPGWRDQFLREYGIEIDSTKLRFYTLLDEFF